jgi:transcriptional regulator GlxA family with amidase domain
VRIEALASSLGRSRRYLSTAFRSEYGITPKQAARVMRFERASALLESGRPIAEVAAACGYYDQPHLTEEWRGLAGASPAAWLTDDLRD